MTNDRLQSRLLVHVSPHLPYARDPPRKQKTNKKSRSFHIHRMFEFRRFCFLFRWGDNGRRGIVLASLYFRAT